MNFGDYLNKYGVIWEEKYLSYAKDVLPNRLGNKLTGIIVHTEGVVGNIEGTADRDVYNWFNNKSNQVNSHGFITFSGKFILYLPIENGSWAAGNLNDNCQTFQIETQDNGRYDNPLTYTPAQYRAWAGVYCALVDWTKERYGVGNEILFDRSARGARRHNEIVKGRVCPGALDVDKIVSLAKEKYYPKDEKKLYRVMDGVSQAGAFESFENTFNFWYNRRDQRVVCDSSDITNDFKSMANKLEIEIQDLKKRIKELEDDLLKKNELIEEFKNNSRSLMKQTESLLLELSILKGQAVIQGDQSQPITPTETIKTSFWKTIYNFLLNKINGRKN